MGNLRGKIIFITGASRGIGRAIGMKAARDGARVVVAAKTVEPHPKLPGTIHEAADQMRQAGGHAMAVQLDVRDEAQVRDAVERVVEEWGGIDILVNNASAIDLRGTLQLPVKKWDLMHQVNARGTWVCSKYCLPHLLKADNPHILSLCPPLNMDAKWFAPHVAYTLAKYGMSACVLGMAEEFRKEGVAVNALWPETTIATAAVMNLLGGEDMVNASRKPAIVADAAYAILTKPSRECTGNFFIDEEVLRSEGVSDFEKYAVKAGNQLFPDLFLPVE